MDGDPHPSGFSEFVNRLRSARGDRSYSPGKMWLTVRTATANFFEAVFLFDLLTGWAPKATPPHLGHRCGFDIVPS